MLGVPIQVAAICAVVAVALTTAGVLLMQWRGRPAPVSAQTGGGVEVPGASADPWAARLEDGPLDRLLVPAVRAVGRGIRRISPAGWIERLERRVRLAGSPARTSVERTLTAKLGLGVGGALIGLQWSGGAMTTTAIGAAIAFGFAGYAAPEALLTRRGRDRQDQIRRSLPDTLDQLTISVEAGLGFDAALARVSESGTGPLAEELRRLLAEVRVGVLRADALRHLLDRTDVQELRQFVLALQHAEQFGLPIAKVLRVQAEELRVKRRQRAEEESLKIPVKIVFPLVLCIFPALFVVLLGPAVIRVLRALG